MTQAEMYKNMKPKHQRAYLLGKLKMLENIKVIEWCNSELKRIEAILKKI